MASSSEKNYGECPKKHEARQKTIIEAWRNTTGLQAVPEGQQYWTLPGKLYNDDGEFQRSCELTHVTKAGLIGPSQFHGVEFNESIHAKNVQVVQKLRQKPHLYQGSMVQVMDQALGAGVFKPGIVNLDTLYEPKRAAYMLGKTLQLVNRTNGVKMVVLNVILAAPKRGRKHTFETLMDATKSNLLCAQQLGYGWDLSCEGWAYNGTGISSTKMGSVIYVQRGYVKEAAIAC